MFVQVSQGDFFLANPAEWSSAWGVLLLCPPVLLLHVTQHIELVQVAQIHTLWTRHVFVRLVNHPEHLVLRRGVHGAGVVLEVGDRHNLPAKLANSLYHAFTLVVSFQVLAQLTDPLELSTGVDGTDCVPLLVDDVPGAVRDHLLFLNSLWKHIKSSFHYTLLHDLHVVHVVPGEDLVKVLIMQLHFVAVVSPVPSQLLSFEASCIRKQVPVLLSGNALMQPG